MNQPWWLTLLLGMGLGSCLTIFLAWVRDEIRQSSTNVTVMRGLERLGGYEARCIDCGMTYRHADPWEASSWAFHHQQLEHRGR